MLLTEPAVLIHLQPVRCILFVFACVVVALLAFRAGKGDSDCHNGTSIGFGFVGLPLFGKQGTKKEPSLRGKDRITLFFCGVKYYLKKSKILGYKSFLAKKYTCLQPSEIGSIEI